MQEVTMGGTRTLEHTSPIQCIHRLITQAGVRRSTRELREAIHLLEHSNDSLDAARLEQVRRLIDKAHSRRPARELSIALSTLSTLHAGT